MATATFAGSFVSSEASSTESEDGNNSSEDVPQRPKTLGELKESNETIAALGFEVDDCEYMVITSDKNVKLPQHFLQYACDNFSSLSKEIHMSGVCGDNVIGAFSYYLPRSTNLDQLQLVQFKLKSPLEESIMICDVFGLSSLQVDLENNLIEEIRITKQLDKQLLEKLVIASKFNLDKSLATFIAKDFHFVFLHRKFNGRGRNAPSELEIKLNDQLMVTYLSSSLPRNIVYELVKNSIKIIFHEVDGEKGIFSSNEYKNGFAEVLCILNFIDLVFYDDNVIDVSPKGKNSKIFERLPFEYDTKNAIGKIACAEEDDDRATLIIEDKKIHIKSFVLIVNSPVFKAMLQSTSFKEGQTKTIELTGKSVDEVVYFLKFLQYSKKIDGRTNISTLAALCQEYQVDWLSDRIESYLSCAKITDVNLILEYLQLAKVMAFNDKVKKNLLARISDHFPKIQSSPLFASLDRKTQMRIARKCLKDLMSSIDGISQETRKSLLFDYDSGLQYFFKDIFPRPPSPEVNSNRQEAPGMVGMAAAVSFCSVPLVLPVPAKGFSFK